MRLKSLELVGFKSFLDPTSISFSPGVTAVVGPNGCGKSNVVDAIRWVLGEQAPTRLRGKSADDLIYAGNDSNAAAGMAEVTLLLEADDNSSLPEPYAALSEVAVTRRVYRSGDSEYLINQIPCRLKDITEFFMAAQIHSRGYALIEQGRIEEIIQSKPHELRGMIEEAAGLSLFKGRREMSERKLERVRENLARVDDVLAEIERQLNFARRQAKKAEAYKPIRVELAELERLTARRRLLEERARLEQSRARSEKLDAAARGDARSARRTSGADRRGAARLAAERDRLTALGRELDNLRAAAAQRGHTRDFLERRLGAIDAAAPELAVRLEELEAKATAARAARAEAGARLARERNEDDGGEAALAALRERHEEAAAALGEAERRSEDTRDEVAELMREAAAIRGRLGALGGERAELEERLRAAAERIPALDEALSAARAALDAADGELAARRTELAALEGRGKEAAEREREARTALDAGAARLALLRESLSAARARAERAARTRRRRRRRASARGARIAQRRPPGRAARDAGRGAAGAGRYPHGARRRARRRGRRGDRRLAPSGAARDRDSQAVPRRPLELHPRTRPDRFPSRDRGAGNCRPAARHARSRAALSPRRRGGTRSCGGRRRSALRAGGVEFKRSRHALRHARRRLGRAGKNDRRRQRRRSGTTTPNRSGAPDAPALEEAAARVEQAESEAASLRRPSRRRAPCSKPRIANSMRGATISARAERAMGERRSALERVERDSNRHARPARAGPRALGGDRPAYRRVQRAA